MNITYICFFIDPHTNFIGGDIQGVNCEDVDDSLLGGKNLNFSCYKHAVYQPHIHSSSYSLYVRWRVKSCGNYGLLRPALDLVTGLHEPYPWAQGRFPGVLWNLNIQSKLLEESSVNKSLQLVLTLYCRWLDMQNFMVCPRGPCSMYTATVLLHTNYHNVLLQHMVVHQMQEQP